MDVVVFLMLKTCTCEVIEWCNNIQSFSAPRSQHEHVFLLKSHTIISLWTKLRKCQSIQVRLP